MIKFKSEIVRKIIHLSSLWIPIAYLYLSKSLMLSILITLTIIALLIEATRKPENKLKIFIDKAFSYMMREEEKTGSALTGATYMLLASCIVIAFFSQEVAIFSLTVLMISDTCAALIGRKYGRIKILDKTLEGSLSFIFSAILIYLFYKVNYGFSLTFLSAFISIILASIVELFSKKLHLDDNLSIPLTISLSLLIL